MMIHFEKLIMLPIFIGLLLIQIVTSNELIQTESLDYWIGSISPRCAINVIYYNLTNDFIFNSTYNIPVMFVPLPYYRDWHSRLTYLKHNKFFRSSLRFLRAECFFSVIYYKFSQSFISRSTTRTQHSAFYCSTGMNQKSGGLTNGLAIR